MDVVILKRVAWGLKDGTEACFNAGGKWDQSRRQKGTKIGGGRGRYIPTGGA